MTDTQLSEDKRLYRRLILSWWDFYRADEFAELLEESWKQETEKMQQVALSISAVVSYGRPFSGNYDRSHTVADFPDDLRKEALNDRDQELHDHLMDTRHQEFAHTDAEVQELTIEMKEYKGETVAIPVSRDTMVPLGPDVTGHLREVIQKLIAVTNREKARLEKGFDAGEAF